MFLKTVKISFFAARHKTFRGRFQFLPARADLFRLGGRDLIVGGGGGDDGEQVGEFLHDLVRRRNQEVRMRRVLGIQNKKSARALANPLDEPLVAGALHERLDAVEGIFHAAARRVARRLRPFVDHGGREFEVGGNFLGRFFLKDFAQQFVGFHAATMPKAQILASGKRLQILGEIVNATRGGMRFNGRDMKPNQVFSSLRRQVGLG
jgi:hypothetical protein